MYSKYFGRSWRWFALIALLALPLFCVAAPSSQTSGFGTPVSDQMLSHYRGGHGIDLNLQNLNAQLRDNQAFNNVTGSNWVADQAFSGASGVPTVIQNSGNNVIIQNATILNVQIQ